MRKKCEQMSLIDTGHSVEKRLEDDKPELFRLLDEYLDWDDIIPDTFHRAFYLRTGRKRKYELESFLRALFLQRVFHYLEDAQLLNTLRFSREMRDFCGTDLPRNGQGAGRSAYLRHHRHQKLCRGKQSQAPAHQSG